MQAFIFLYKIKWHWGLICPTLLIRDMACGAYMSSLFQSLPISLFRLFSIWHMNSLGPYLTSSDVLIPSMLVATLFPLIFSLIFCIYFTLYHRVIDCPKIQPTCLPLLPMLSSYLYLFLHLNSFLFVVALLLPFTGKTCRSPIHLCPSISPPPFHCH